jgi:glyoxalase family protein
MLTQIEGLHHVTAMAKDARRNNSFYTGTLGLRRVKQTVNFDAPDVYHLYYADGAGTPGSVITFFPFPNSARGRAGVGEAGVTAYAVPEGSFEFWRDRLAAHGATDVVEETRFGERRLRFSGPDGEGIALVETTGDARAPWTGSGVDERHAIRGFHSVSLRLKKSGSTAELLEFMGYEKAGVEGNVERFRLAAGNGADAVDLETLPDLPFADLGAGSVHHVAFAVADRAAQLAVQEALTARGHHVTPVIDRDYFWAIYFRTPGGVLFEVATAEPGFARDEAPEHLGEALQLPEQHRHLRPYLEKHLEPLEA